MLSIPTLAYTNDATNRRPSALGERGAFWYTQVVKSDEPEITIQLKRRWLLGLAVLPVLLQAILPSRVWVALFFGLGGALGLAYLWARQLAGRVRITREQHYGWVHVGDILQERFTLHNDALFPALWVEIDDQSDLPGYSARSVRSAGGQQVVKWRTEGICRQRGLFRLGPWQAQMGDPFGFFDVRVRYPAGPVDPHLPAGRPPANHPTAPGRDHRHRPHQPARAGRDDQRRRRARLRPRRQPEPHPLADHRPPRDAHGQDLRPGAVGRPVDRARHGRRRAGRPGRRIHRGVWRHPGLLPGRPGAQPEPGRGAGGLRHGRLAPGARRRATAHPRPAAEGPGPAVAHPRSAGHRPGRRALAPGPRPGRNGPQPGPGHDPGRHHPVVRRRLGGRAAAAHAPGRGAGGAPARRRLIPA